MLVSKEIIRGHAVCGVIFIMRPLAGVVAAKQLNEFFLNIRTGMGRQ
jgi:hypothetical protein